MAESAQTKRAVRPRWPQVVLARRVADWDGLPLVALALLVVGIAVVVGRIAVTNHHVFNDEASAVLFGRTIAEDLSQAFSGDIDRGPERLMSLMTALIAVFSDSASHQVWALHALTAICQGLVALPTWLAGRELGLSRWAALVGAAIAAAGSFAVYGIFLLNQAVGLLCATLLLWAMLRALRRPGPASDLLVLATLAATVLARIGWAPLVVALVPGALATVWFERPESEGLRAWVRALPRRVASRHPVLVPVLVLGVFTVLIWGPSALLGGKQYGGIRLEPDLELTGLWNNARFLFSHLAIAIALVPFILAVPVLLRDLVKPPDPTRGGFAWLVVGLLVVFSYAYYSAMNEDRYLAVLAPAFALAGTLAFFNRPPPPWAVLISGLLTARLVTTSYGWPEQGPFDYFVAPTSRFFDRIVVGDLMGRLPLTSDHGSTFAMLGALAAALLLVIVARRPRPWHPLGVVSVSIVLAGVLAFQVVAADYPARKFVDAVGAPDLPTDAPSFIDRAARGGRAEPLAVDGGVHPDIYAQFPFLRVYNRNIGIGFTVMRGPGQPGASAPITPRARLSWRTGDIRLHGTAPDLLVQAPGFNGVGFSGSALPASPYYPFAQLFRLRHPLDVRWIVRGDSVQGFPEAGRPIRLRVFPSARRGICVEGGIAVHTLAASPSRYRVTGTTRILRGVAQPGAPEPFVARLRGERPTTLVLRGTPGKLPDMTEVGPSFVDLRVSDCG